MKYPRTKRNLAIAAKMDRIIFPDDLPFEPRKRSMLWMNIGGFGWARDIRGARVLERSGVLPDQRGKGFHSRLIQERCQGAKVAITYTVPDNWHSITNLILNGFRRYDPEWAWAGADMVYWKRTV
jgi:hypothetical protein